MATMILTDLLVRRAIRKQYWAEEKVRVVLAE
jgi:hypothetical protein